VKQNVAVRSAEFVQGPEVVGCNHDVAVGTIGHFVLLLWRHRIVAPGVGWTREAFARSLRDREPVGKLIFLTAVESECDVSTPTEVRKGIADLLKAYEDTIACAAIVFEGSGFGMTIVRSVITAIYIASRSRFPNGVFSDVGGAVTWMRSQAERGGISIANAPVEGAFNKLRAL
jgi:hypothetical protein